MTRMIKVLAVAIVALMGADAQAAALSAARATPSKSLGSIKAFKVKASHTIYAGSLVMIDSAGYAHAAEASASNNGIVGVAVKTVTAAASGTYWVEAQAGVFQFAGTSLLIANIGDLMYAADDQTFDETAGANQPIAGILLEVTSSTLGWIYVSPSAPVRVASSADPLTLTDDLTCSGGAGALTFSDTASSIVLLDNDTTALLIGSTGQLGLMTFDTGNATETVQINGTTTVTALDVAVGTVAIAEDLAIAGGASALSFSDSASSIVLPDNDTTALLIGSTDKLNLMTFDTGDGAETVTINGAAGVEALLVNTGKSTFKDSIALSDGLTIDQSANNVLSIAENAEDVEVTFAANAVSLSSTTGVVSVDFGLVLPICTATGALGWAVVAGANTACNTTCTHACVFGQNTADFSIVACTDAAADVCVCAGSN